MRKYQVQGAHGRPSLRGNLNHWRLSTLSSIRVGFRLVPELIESLRGIDGVGSLGYHLSPWLRFLAHLGGLLPVRHVAIVRLFLQSVSPMSLRLQPAASDHVNSFLSQSQSRTLSMRKKKTCSHLGEIFYAGLILGSRLGLDDGRDLL